MSTPRALAGSTLLLLVTTLSACAGGSSGAPDDASVEDFCAAYFDLFAGGMAGLDPAAPSAERDETMVEAVRTWADTMADVGTPEDMSDEAREGFELIVEAVTDLDDVDQLQDLDDSFSEKEQAAAEAFETYATQSCESPFGDSP